MIHLHGRRKGHLSLESVTVDHPMGTYRAREKRTAVKVDSLHTVCNEFFSDNGTTQSKLSKWQYIPYNPIRY